MSRRENNMFRGDWSWGCPTRTGRSRATSPARPDWTSPCPIARPRLVFAAAAVAVAALTAAGSGVAEAGTVALNVDACVPADRAQLDRLVALELAAAAPDADGELRLACDGERITIAWRASAGDAIDRVVDAGPETGRERTLAIAAVELAVAGGEGPPPAPVVDTTAAVTPPPRRAPWRTTLDAAVVLLASGDLSAPGGSLRLARERAGWGFSLDLGQLHGRDAVELGDIELDATTAAAQQRTSTRVAGVRVHVAAGGRATHARFRGVADRGATSASVAGIAAGPLASVGAERCRGALCLGLAAEAGWHLATVHATVDGMDARALDGAWWLARAGIGVQW